MKCAPEPMRLMSPLIKCVIRAWRRPESWFHGVAARRLTICERRASKKPICSSANVTSRTEITTARKVISNPNAASSSASRQKGVSKDNKSKT
jgi:hypothetical protein